MKSSSLGLLDKAQIKSINIRLQALGHAELGDGNELLIASAIRRARDARDQVTMISLAMSMVTLAVAVIVGSVATGSSFGLILLAYLAAGGILGILAFKVMTQAASAEIARVVIERRIALADKSSDVDRVHPTVARRDASAPSVRKLLMRVRRAGQRRLLASEVQESRASARPCTHANRTSGASNT